MTASDFQYDGVNLSDEGFMICQFDESPGFSSSSAGATMEVTTVPQFSGRKYVNVGTSYDERFTTTFSICKINGKPVTTTEYSSIMRWLNRPEFHSLTIMSTLYQDVTFHCTFNIEKVEFCGSIVGFNLLLISDSAFGWGDQVSYEFNIGAAGGVYEINNTSDEIGYIYPDYLKITCAADGDLVIANALENRSTEIKGCSNGEVLEFNGNTMAFKSSTGRNVYDSFNFNFLRLATTYDNRTNAFTFSIPCSVELTFTPTKKVVL